MKFPLHVTCSCIPMHMYVYSIYFDIFLQLGTFQIVSFSISFSSICISLLLWHLNTNLLRPKTLFVLGHLLLLILLLSLSGSMIRRSNRTSLRTSLDEAFIRNAKSSCWTSLTMTFPLSSTIGNGGHCVTSRSPVHPC